MKNKKIYIAPDIEVVEIELENVIANSPDNGVSFDISEESHSGGASRSKRFNWDNE